MGQAIIWVNGNAKNIQSNLISGGMRHFSASSLMEVTDSGKSQFACKDKQVE